MVPSHTNKLLIATDKPFKETDESFKMNEVDVPKSNIAINWTLKTVSHHHVKDTQK